MAALKSGLQKNDLLFSLEKKYPRDFADVLARAEGYARVEEAFKMKDEEIARERQVGDSSKPTVEKGASEAQPHSRTPFEHKRVQTPLELVGRGARTIGFGRALPQEDSTATPLSML